ncbi:hypothetical protein D3C86_1451130 [compost metagenome]
MSSLVSVSIFTKETFPRYFPPENSIKFFVILTSVPKHTKSETTIYFLFSKLCFSSLLYSFVIGPILSKTKISSFKSFDKIDRMNVLVKL